MCRQSLGFAFNFKIYLLKVFVLIVPDSPLELLAAAATRRRREAFRPGTVKNYLSSQKLFLQFCLVYAVDVQYPTDLELASYAEWLVQGGLSCATIRNHFTAVKLLFQWWGKEDIVRSLSSHAWTLTIKGLLNTVRPTFQKRAAMTLEHLTALVQTCHLRESFTPLKVAVTFGFFAFLRISNLAPPTVGLFDPTRHTTFGDVQQSDDGIVLNLLSLCCRCTISH